MAADDVFGIVGTTQAGNFHVELAVAEGGFGVVYRAQHGGFRAPVALKCLKVPEELTQRQREIFLEKFREEAELLFRLSASIPSVVRPLHIDVLKLDGGGFVPFLAMEWLEGESLDEIITRRADNKQAPLGIHKLIKLLKPVALALARAHRFPGPKGTESIVHRDLKPENIFVANIGGVDTVKILDFGIAKARKLASEAAGRLTGQYVEEDEAASFTPAYAAPEQWAPKRFGASGPWTDVWGLALTMVEALIGGPAIDGDTYGMRRLTLDEQKRPTPRTLGAVVQDEVERIFERALAVDPRKRIQDIETFWTEIERALGLPQSFGTRDNRREDGDEQPAVVPSSGRTSEPGVRLARIELQRVERPVNASPSIPAAPPAPTVSEPPPGPISNDFSDVFVPSEPPPPPGKPSSKRQAPQVSAESLEFDLDAAPAAVRPVTVRPAPSPSYPASAPPPRDSARFDLTPTSDPARSSRSSGDSEVSLPTEGTPGSGPRSPLRTPASDRSRPPPPMSDDNLEASLDMTPGRRPAIRPDAGLDLDVAPRSVQRAARAEPVPRYDATIPVNVPGRVRPGALEPDAPRPEGSSEYQSLGARIRGPLSVISLAIVISLAEVVYTRITGTPLMLGPVRPFWIAAPLALIGIAFTLWRFIGDHDDG